MEYNSLFFVVYDHYFKRTFCENNFYRISESEVRIYLNCYLGLFQKK